MSTCMAMTDSNNFPEFDAVSTLSKMMFEGGRVLIGVFFLFGLIFPEEKSLQKLIRVNTMVAPLFLRVSSPFSPSTMLRDWLMTTRTISYPTPMC